MKQGRSKMMALISIVLIPFVASASSRNWPPTKNQVAELESRLTLERIPGWDASGPSTLKAYERFYTEANQSGQKVILGELVLPTEPSEHPGVKIVSSSDDFPAVSGGGCTIIHVVYSVPKSAITSIYCNGSV